MKTLVYTLITVCVYVTVARILVNVERVERFYTNNNEHYGLCETKKSLGFDWRTANIRLFENTIIPDCDTATGRVATTKTSWLFTTATETTFVDY